ncbi:MAG: hypothetical protein HYX63_23930 [Gammaproteobacteria bacterium]|nr:hypothetical protein [Gammaproteobacteria bacterium]
MEINRTALPVTGPAPANGGVMHTLRSMLFGDGPSFSDVLDLVNPLQHIPIIGSLYRKLTGDVIAPAIRVAGGALFGGPLGAALSLGSMLVEPASAKEGAPRTADPVVALAEASSGQPYRGGWIVNAAMTGQMLPFAPSSIPATAEATKSPAKIAETNHPEVRRGGWIVAQAYALNAAEQAANDKVAGQIDDAV